MDQHQTEFEKIDRDNLTVRTIRILGGILSFSVLVLIFKWTADLYERDINDLPKIVAIQEDIRVRPEERGGTEIKFKGLSVNEVLNETVVNSITMPVNLAPKNQTLLDNERNPALLPADHGPSGDGDLANSIAKALENLLGLEERAVEIPEQNIELHIASYSTADKANAHWFLLQQLNSDLLVNYNHQVVKVTNIENEVYRLRIVGFKSVALAQDMCDRLIKRGEQCVPSVGLK